MKKVEVSPVCPLCNVSTESTVHILVKCSFAVACWQEAHVTEVDGEANTFADWLSHVFMYSSKDKIQIIVMIFWMVWKCRNE